jgi:hypothetical protein
MKRKNVQMVMWWLLPIIIFVGIWWHYIGYVVLAMMIVFLTLSVFKGRYWCGLCEKVCPVNIYPGSFKKSGEGVSIVYV